jgi:NHL repeat
MNFHHSPWRFTLAAALAVALSGCGGGLQSAFAGAQTPLAGSATSSALRVPLALQNITPNRNGRMPKHKSAPVHGFLSAQATTGKNLVYVASLAGSAGAVYVFPAGGQSHPPVGAIVNGISLPAGIAVDGGGSLYVANTGNNTVTVYPPGQLSPTTTYTAGVNAPQGVAVGNDGTVYVANETGSPSGAGSVTEYPAGSTSPSATITQAGMYAFAVGLDASNNLYVSWFDLSSFGIQIYKYAPGSTQGTNLNLNLPEYVFPVFGIAFDSAGDLVIAIEQLDHNPPKYIEVFAPGATQPKKKIDEGDLLDVVEGIAFPKSSRVFYVACANDNDWLKLTYPRGLPRDVTDVIAPGGLALSPQ